MEEVCKNISLIVLTESNSEEFFRDNSWLDKHRFLEICKLYAYPKEPMTIVIEDYYVDAAYRDIYYTYLSKIHFDCRRQCRRIFLFRGSHTKEEVFSDLSEDFLVQ